VTAPGAQVRYRFGPFELQPDERRLLATGTPVHLGSHALDVLVALIERSGLLVSKDELLQRVWGKVIVADNTLQVHISALRKVLGADAIATVSGRGYRFTLDVTQFRATSAARAELPKHNLPHDLTSFVGRDKELAELGRLSSLARLLTLTGAGGCGKTRLAIQLARQRADAHPDGVWLVELASLADAALLPQTVGNVLGVKETPGAGLVDTLAEYLAPRALLLVLDNAEHLIDACARLAESLLQRCARLAVVVTSRERLAITGEQTYRVPSLSVPDSACDTTPESIESHESARLFIDRARLQLPHFAITKQNSTAIASICRRLDGIALALELAAPCLRILAVDELNRRLVQRFEVLTEGSRTALPRHRTLRALIDWSYDLLTDKERTVLRRAAVFSGGWTTEAAARVCCGGIVDATDLPGFLTSLGDKNVIVTETRGETTRFGMLETVRHYAQDRLRESGEETDVRARHLEYLSQMAEKLYEPQTDSELQDKLDRLDREHDNLRAALAWCEADVTRSANGLALAGLLSWFWRTRGHFSEGRRWIARLLVTAPASERRRDRARALSTASVLAYLQDDYATAEARSQDALALWQELGVPRGIATELGNLGNIALNRGDYATARNLFEQSLTIAREAGDQRNMLVLLQNLASITHEMGDFAAAQTLLEECLPISREMGKWSTSEVLGQLGLARQAQGDIEGARALLTEALEGEREFGNRQGVARTLVWLGVVSHEAGDIATARMQVAEALVIQQAVGDRVYMAAALEAFAALAMEFANPTHAARFWGRAQRLREQIGVPQGISDRARSESLVAAARRATQDDAAFDLAWNEGRSWTLDEAVRHALDA